MSTYKEVNLERIKNGWLAHFVEEQDPTEWTPEKDKVKKEFLGLEIDPRETYYAPSLERALELVKEIVGE